MPRHSAFNPFNPETQHCTVPGSCWGDKSVLPTLKKENNGKSGISARTLLQFWDKVSWIVFMVLSSCTCNFLGALIWKKTQHLQSSAALGKNLKLLGNLGSEEF